MRYAVIEYAIDDDRDSQVAGIHSTWRTEEAALETAARLNDDADPYEASFDVEEVPEDHDPDGIEHDELARAYQRRLAKRAEDESAEVEKQRLAAIEWEAERVRQLADPKPWIVHCADCDTRIEILHLERATCKCGAAKFDPTSGISITGTTIKELQWGTFGIYDRPRGEGVAIRLLGNFIMPRAVKE